MRTFQDADGVEWSVSEVTRYGIGARPSGAPPVEANIAILKLTAADGRSVTAETSAREWKGYSEEELRSLLSEALAHEKEQDL